MDLVKLHVAFKKVFREIKLADFVNYDELKDNPPECDEEKKAENVEMTE